MTIRKLFLFLIILTLGCERKTNDKENTKEEIRFETKTACAEKLDDFIKSLSDKNKQDVKKAFTFPVNDLEGNIWNLIYIDKDTLVSGEQTFTEADFNKNYDKLFTPGFVKTLSDTDIEKLFKDKYYRTKEISEGNAEEKIVNYTISEFNSKTGILTFSYMYEYYENDEKVGESSVIYFFILSRECEIKFQKVMLAG